MLSGPTDKRKTPRRTADRARRPVWVKEQRDGSEYMYLATNLSEGGAFLGNAIPRPLGTILELELDLADEASTIAAACRVIRVNTEGKLGVAVKFVRISAEGYWRIRRYVRESSSETKSDRRRN